MTKRKPAKLPGVADLRDPEPTLSLADLRELILQARESLARAVDLGLTILCRHVGQRIRQFILKKEFVASPMRQFAWKRLIELTPLDSPLRRDFYAEICRVEGSSVRTQRPKIDGCAKRRLSGSRAFITAHPSVWIAAAFLCR